MRRLAVLATVLALSVTGCNWSQGWHWPRWYANGSTATETLVYFEAWRGLRADHAAIADWARNVWTRSPAVAVRLVQTCPQGRNCVRWRSADLPYPVNGQTWISTGSDRHILTATVYLDIGLTNADSVNVRRETGCVESMLALGGGWDNPTTGFDEHSIGCNGYGWPTAHDYAEIAAAYDHHG